MSLWNRPIHHPRPDQSVNILQGRTQQPKSAVTQQPKRNKRTWRKIEIDLGVVQSDFKKFDNIQGIGFWLMRVIKNSTRQLNTTAEIFIKFNGEGDGLPFRGGNSIMDEEFEFVEMKWSTLAGHTAIISWVHQTYGNPNNNLSVQS